jgi:hypothetical protein
VNGVDLMVQSMAAPARKIEELLDWLEEAKGQKPVGGREDAELIQGLVEEWLDKNPVPTEVVLSALVALLHNAYIAMADVEDWIDVLENKEPGHN